MTVHVAVHVAVQVSQWQYMMAGMGLVEVSQERAKDDKAEAQTNLQVTSGGT